MRAMGPGSVSSLLKTALDVVHYLLSALAPFFVLAAVAVLAFKVDLDKVATIRENGVATQVELTGPMLAGSLVVMAAYDLVLLLITGRLRKIFGALTAGDPFDPANVLRLRLVGLGLVGLEGLNALVHGLGKLFPFIFILRPGAAFDLTPWFSVLVVFVLAEVFREGARLRREAELTI